jgi:hypothetical protein
MQNPIRLGEIESDRLYKQSELCSLLGRSPAYFERHRWSRTGIPYVRVGRTPFYKGADVRAWIEGTRVEPQAA